MRIQHLQAYSIQNKKNVNNNLVSFSSRGQKSSSKSVAVMAPLLIEKEEGWAEFRSDLKKVKEAGAEAISVDVWWGKTEAAGDEKFDWSYYDRAFQMIKEEGLHIVPIMSLHACGGNVGDNVNIPIPKWAWERVAKLNDSSIQQVQYENEQGKYLDDVIPIWYDNQIKDEYKEYITAFSEHFINNPKYAGIIDEVNISLGPSGELRYPSYGEDTKRLGTNCPFPKRGNFMGYSTAAKDSYRSYLKDKYNNDINELNTSWKSSHKNFNTIEPPSSASAIPGRATKFLKRQEYITTQEGLDFTGWYHNSLMDHGKMMLELADEVLDEAGSDIPIGMKLTGIHWGMGIEKIGDRSDTRLSELTAGIISVDAAKMYNEAYTDYGYADVLDLAKKSTRINDRNTIFHFTCLEKPNGDNHPKGTKFNYSLAKSLVNLMIDGAKKRGLTMKGENALPGCIQSEPARENILDAMGRGYDGITLLRLDDVSSPDSVKYLDTFVRNVKDPSTREKKQ